MKHVFGNEKWNLHNSLFYMSKFSIEINISNLPHSPLFEISIMNITNDGRGVEFNIG